MRYSTYVGGVSEKGDPRRLPPTFTLSSMPQTPSLSVNFAYDAAIHDWYCVNMDTIRVILYFCKNWTLD